MMYYLSCVSERLLKILKAVKKKKSENTRWFWKSAATLPFTLVLLAAARVKSCLLPFSSFFISPTNRKPTGQGVNTKLTLKTEKHRLNTGHPQSLKPEPSQFPYRCLWVDVLTFDTRRGPTREDGLPPTAWPRPAGWRRPLGSDPASVGWWWRWWSWSSKGCPRAGGRPTPPLIPHLKKKKKEDR